MAILIRLDELLHARRMTLTELAAEIGITVPNLSILKTGKARAIRFSTLEAICAALQCQPGELMEYTRDEPNRADPLEQGGRPVRARADEEPPHG